MLARREDGDVVMFLFLVAATFELFTNQTQAPVAKVAPSSKPV